jgi:hypothetical protein
MAGSVEGHCIIIILVSKEQAERATSTGADTLQCIIFSGRHCRKFKAPTIDPFVIYRFLSKLSNSEALC